jgi:large subunit ribosomal protein L27
MAKTAGKLTQTRPRPGKRLGVKIYGGQKVANGNIIIRQRGANFKPGVGTKMGKDYTIYAIKNGTVSFRKLNDKNFVEVA